MINLTIESQTNSIHNPGHNFNIVMDAGGLFIGCDDFLLCHAMHCCCTNLNQKYYSIADAEHIFKRCAR